MSIVPLPVFEADADAKHRDALTIEEQHAQLSPPETLVVRFGALDGLVNMPMKAIFRQVVGPSLLLVHIAAQNWWRCSPRHAQMRVAENPLHAKKC